MERREIAEAMRRDGVNLEAIAREVRASKTTVHRWVRHIKKPLTYDTAKKKGYLMGSSKDLHPNVMPVIAKEIRGNETIIACMSRLVAAMSQDETSQKERD